MVSVEKGSSIKVYGSEEGSVKEFLLGYDASRVSILEPQNFKDLNNISSDGIKGRYPKLI